MVAEYTSDTVERIRHLARSDYPPGAVAWMLGWPLERLRGLCQTHQIEFAGPLKNRVLVKLGMHWDGEHAWKDEKSVYLPPAQGRIFQVLVRSTYKWTHGELAARAAVPVRTLSTHLQSLRRNLRSIGVELSQRPYHLVRRGKSL